MIILSILFNFIMTTNCSSARDMKFVGKSVTNKILHKYFQTSFNLPLGIYEQLDLKNTPWLAEYNSKVPSLIAIPSQKNKLRAISLIVNGAWYAQNCDLTKKGPISRNVTLNSVLKTFRVAMSAKMPKVRKSILNYALFKLGIFLADTTSVKGPAKRLQSFLSSVLTSNKSLVKGSVLGENKEGVRYPVLIKTGVPKGTVKIILISSVGFKSKILPWPMNSKHSSEYPKFLLKK